MRQRANPGSPWCPRPYRRTRQAAIEAMHKLLTTGTARLTNNINFALRTVIYREFRLLFIRGHGVITQQERIETMLAWLRDPVTNLALLPFST
jgi:hypothetical protein